MKKIFLSLTAGLFLFFYTDLAFANRSELVMNAKTGEVLYERYAEVQRYPASLTKLMTLYVAFSALDEGIVELDDKLPVSEYASSMKKSKMFLKTDTYITLENAILSVILRSANDAAVVIAEGLAGSEENFAKLMNEKALELGLTKTHFTNANGLFNQEQKSTAKDLATLSYALMNNFPQYYPMFSKKSFFFNGKTYRSNNALLLYRKDVEGLKTGYVAKSGYHIITVINKGDEKLIVVVMGRSNPRQRDQVAMNTAGKGFYRIKNPKKDKGYEIITTSKPSFSGVEAFEIASNMERAKEKSETLPDAGSMRIVAETGDWSIQVGTFKSRKRALSAGLEAKSALFAEGSEGADIHVSRITRNKKGYYSSKIVDLSKEAAINACEEIKSYKKPCMVISPK